MNWHEGLGWTEICSLLDGYKEMSIDYCPRLLSYLFFSSNEKDVFVVSEMGLHECANRFDRKDKLIGLLKHFHNGDK